MSSILMATSFLNLPIILGRFPKADALFTYELQATEKNQRIQTPEAGFERFLHLHYYACDIYVNTNRNTILLHLAPKDYCNSHPDL